MHTIQAADCDGTALTTTVTGQAIEHLGTVHSHLLTLKTGRTAAGQRNRILTFVVTGPLGTLTYTRGAGGKVVDDFTGLELTEPAPRLGNCELCGDTAGRGSQRVRDEDGSTTLLCRDCMELEHAC